MQFLVLLLAACQNAADSGAVADDSSAPLDCAVGSHQDGAACVATLSGWEDAPKLTFARDHHVTFVAETDAGPALYALAGTSKSGEANVTVERAWIADDGSLSDWETLESLPGGRIGCGLAQQGNTVVMAGGLLPESTSTAATWVITVNPDGTLFVDDGTSLHTSRYHVALVLSHGFIYATGGMEQTSGDVAGQTVLSSVERAPFDGVTLGKWEELGDLPEPTTHHGFVVREDALYVIGGGDGRKARDTMLRADIAADGSLGAWAEAGTLPEGRATSAASVFLDQLYVIAGMKTLTGKEVDTVLRADFGDDGSVGAFEELPPLPKARAHSHQTPFYNGAIYSVAGSIVHKDQDEVYVGRLE